MGNYISDEQWMQYHREGYLKLGKVPGDTEFEALQQRMDDIMLGTAPLDFDKIMMQLDSDTGDYGNMKPMTFGHKGPTLNYRKIEQLEFDPLFLAYMQQPIFREICARTYGGHVSIACFRAMFMNKPSRKGTVLPWHQDGGDGWAIDRDPLVTVWTALDPATIANGCVQVIPGSHQLGLLSDQGHTISADQVERYCSEDKIVYCELEAGEVMILHNWLLHRSDVNNTDVPRRGFSVCYMDARTRSTRDDAREFSVIFGKGALVPEELPIHPQ